MLQVEHSRHPVLSVVLVLLLLPEVFPEAVDLPVGVACDGHACVGRDLLSMRVQHRHHNGWRPVVLNPGVGAFLAHESHLEVFCGGTLHAQLILPLLEQRLEDEQVVVVLGLLL